MLTDADDIRDVDALLEAIAAGDDAPTGPVADLLRAAASDLEVVAGPTDDEVAAWRAALAGGAGAGRWRARRLVPVLVVGGSLLFGGAAAAANGSLPGPLQGIVHDVGDLVGVDIPDQDDEATPADESDDQGDGQGGGQRNGQGGGQRNEGGVDGVGSDGTAPGQGGTVPGTGAEGGGNGVGSDGTAPGQGGTVPGTGEEVGGGGSSGVGADGTPPGQGGTIPGSGDTTPVRPTTPATPSTPTTPVPGAQGQGGNPNG